jgi:hypothetical protein
MLAAAIRATTVVLPIQTAAASRTASLGMLMTGCERIALVDLRFLLELSL